MAKYDDAFAQFTSEMNAIGYHHHEDSYHAVMKYLGPSVHDQDAALVACSDKKETDYIKSHFLVGKLGLDKDDARLDDAILQVCHALGESNTKKHRASFYYLLMAILDVDYAKLS